MLSLLTSVPTSIASSTWSFFSNRRKTFAYLGATVGGAYAVGQWGLQRMLEASERGRKHTGAKNDLLNRFNLNLQDAQFTVQALLPTVASQLHQSLDVEERTTELGEIAKREKLARLKQVELAQAEAEQTREPEREEEVHSEETAVDGSSGGAQVPVASGEEHHSSPQESTTTTTTTTTNGVTADEGSATTLVKEPALPPITTRLTLNPAAPAFQPRFTPPSPPRDEFPKLDGHTDPASNGESSSRNDDEVVRVEQAERTTSEDGDASGALGKSWAEVVKTTEGSDSVGNGEPEVEGDAVQERSGLEEREIAEKTSRPVSPSATQSTVPSQDTPIDPSLAGPKEPESPAVPTKSKVQLWNEVKVLSFTRLLTSIYVLSLLTVQTHVQLALLGRAHYVKSLVDALPPRSDGSSPESKGKGKAATEPTLFNEDDDLEAALYRAKQLPTREEDRVSEEVEKKYLTYSWWLLHEGWKVVKDRVEEKVEEVVGPMGLKTPVVYGELSSLLGEIRKRIETQPDGSRFDFSAALHPPTPADERHTLVTGGGFADAVSVAPSSSSSVASTSLVPPPLRSLLNETSDFLLSPDGSLVLTLLLDRLLALSISKLEPAFSTPLAPYPSSEAGRGARFEDVTEKQTRLASLLPVLTRLSAAGSEGQAGILRSGHGNEFIEAIDDVRELKEFVAIVYASYDRDNLRASY